MYEELKKLAESATPGPWKSTIDGVMPVGEAFGIFGNFGANNGEANREFIAAANPSAVLALIAENEVARMRIKELDLLFGRYILAMRAAVIEENAEKGMEWIYNSLAGPGELPPEDETDAQAYFDREIIAVEKGMDEVLAFHDARRKAKEPAN